MLNRAFKMERPWSRRLLGCGVLLLLLLSGSPAQADAVFESGPRQVALVELFTSQGCSSCPAADNWLSGLKTQKGLWKNFVPLAFHVDFWDYIGWQDPFGQPEFGNRQRQYEEEGGIIAVYTPGMLLNGVAWLGWAGGENPVRSQEAAGELRVEFNDQEITVQYTPSKAIADNLRVHVAILGFDMKSQITRGENRGRELTNDFIVLRLLETPLKSEAGQYTAVLPAIVPVQKNSSLGVAVWVATASALRPLQAVGGWIDG